MGVVAKKLKKRKLEAPVDTVAKKSKSVNGKPKEKKQATEVKDSKAKKTQKVDSQVKSQASADELKKKKRPWRNAVRRNARKLRLQAEKALNPPPVVAPTPSADGKKKRKKKKKKAITGENGQSAQSDDVDAGPSKKSVADKPEPDLKEKLTSSQFRYINEQLYTRSAKEAEVVFREDVQAFHTYHKGYASQVKKWPLNPLDNIILDLGTLPDGAQVADLGCGTAQIAQKLGQRLKVHSFDLVAANEHVTPCNIVKTPLKDGQVDVAVYCLSLMGTNLGDFFREANRILKVGGKLKIAEVLSRFRHVKNFIRAVEQMGFELKKKRDLKDFFVLLTFTKTGKVKQKRPTGLILEPCLYKKR